MKRIEIYDTTLRDGTQGLDFNLTAEDKLAIAKRLDDFGVDFIEGGWPGSNPKDMKFFNLMKDVKLKTAKLSAFGSTRHRNNKAEDDSNLLALLEAETPVVTIFGKTWDLHVTEALGATLEQNLEMIESSIAFMKSKGKIVVYDAEHYFDGYKADSSYALKTLDAALSGGADKIVLCDTNGGSLPNFIADRIAEACEKYEVDIGIHAHNDSELAVANSLIAVEAGAVHVQGTINGYGERCGNANLTSIIPNLALKMNYDLPQDLATLKEISHFVDERANLRPYIRAAFVSDSAFAHKGGVHVSAVNKNPDTYEHIKPELVGNKRRILLSDLSGKANILAKADEYGVDIDSHDPAVKEIVDRMKILENRGYSFEGSEASFQLMSKKVKGEYSPYFNLHGFNVAIVKRDKDKKPVSEATIKLDVKGKLEHTAASGDGPVNALDLALRKALIRFYPCLSELELIDYKVRVLAGVESGTTSVVRVLVETSDGKDKWGTVGASTDIINASYEALIDAIEYKLLKDGIEPKG